MSDENELLEAGEAARYLAEKWGIPSYSTEAFKMLRVRWGLKPTVRGKKTTLWSKADLDAIPQPGKRKSADEDETKDDPHLVAMNV